MAADSSEMNFVPAFSDFGKATRDLFTKGYHYGFYKIEWKPKSTSSIDFILRGRNCHETGTVVGELEAKRKWSDFGMTTELKCSTDKKLELKFSQHDFQMKGAQFGVDAQLNPHTGKVACKLKSEFKNDVVRPEFGIDVCGSGVTGALVVRPHSNWLLGGRVVYDRSTGDLTAIEGGISFVCRENNFGFTANVNQAGCCSVLSHYKINDEVDVGVMRMTGGEVSKCGFAMKYSPGGQRTFKAKIDNHCNIGLLFKQQIADGLNLSISALVDAKKLEGGKHKIGIGVEI